MPLPKPKEKYYSCVLPATGEKIHFKPFTVRDQKHFLMEAENKKEDNFKYNIIYNIIKNCCKEDIDNLFIIDFDYLYFQVRKYSIGEDLELKFKYKYFSEEDLELEQQDSIEYKINIETDIKYNEISPDVLTMMLKTDEYIINIEQPKVKDVVNSINYEDKQGYLIATMLHSVEQNNELYNDFIIDDAKNFIENLSPKDYNEIEYFLLKNPTLYFDKIIKLPKADKEINLGDRPYTDFFLYS